MGTLTPYLRKQVNRNYEGVSYITGNDYSNAHALGIEYRSVWPSVVPELNQGRTLTQAVSGLPQIRGNTSLEVLYQQSKVINSEASVVLHDSTREKISPLGAGHALEKLPTSVRTHNYQGQVYFPNLPPHLSQRLFFDPNRSALILKGEVISQSLGDAYVLLNVLRGEDLKLVKALCDANDQNKQGWDATVDALTTKLDKFVENPSSPGAYGKESALNLPDSYPVPVGVSDVVDIKDDDIAVDSYALSASGPGSGYVTLIAGNGRVFTAPEEPVSLHVIQVSTNLFAGDLSIIPASNPLDEHITFLHTPDLGGATEAFEYQWLKGQPTDGKSPTLSPGETLANVTQQGWIKIDFQGQPDTDHRHYLYGGSGVEALLDNYLSVRYRPVPDQGTALGPEDGWSDWASPGLAEGWIKRVLAGINPFNQRMNDLFTHAVNTDASLLTLAGKRWEGDIALNLENVSEHGLIEIYETVLKRGKNLSIDAGINNSGANNALLLAAGYLNDLYRILGDEALTDASDPTVSIGSQHGELADVATSLYSFQGQVASLLDEELALLRGRDDALQTGVETGPVYNRLFWNYTRGIESGEVVYALNYNIVEKPDETRDGIINAEDALHMYPQGHGDAYGHYLTALKGYYQLLLDREFTWVPRVESVNLLGKPIQVDYQDERKFAATAASMARTGNRIYELTWRKDFTPGSKNGWGHLSHSRINDQRSYVSGTETRKVERHWGSDHWAARMGQGGYLNWVVGNAMLPAVDEDPNHEGIQKIDRTTVIELAELPSLGQELQIQLDQAGSGLNPLGLSSGSIAFDIDPRGIDPSTITTRTTHFDQILSRAEKALRNAVISFNDAQDISRAKKLDEGDLNELQAEIESSELAYKHQLIEIYGTPYPDDIGPGKTYAQGYDGPDLYHYMYMDEGGLIPANKIPNVFEPAVERKFKVDLQNASKRFNEFDVAVIDFNNIVPFIDVHTGGLQDQPVQFIDGEPTYVNITPFTMVAKNLTWDNKNYSNQQFVEYVLDADGVVAKPSDWKSRRSSPGQLQLALSNVRLAHNAAAEALEAHEGLKYQLDRQIELFEALIKKHDLVRFFKREKIGAESHYDLSKQIHEHLNEVLSATKTIATITVDSAKEGAPDVTVVGTTNGGDIFSPFKATLEEAKVGEEVAYQSAKTALKYIATISEKLFQAQIAYIDFAGISPQEWSYEQKENVLELEMMLKELQMSLFTINEKLHEQEDALMQYHALLAKGERLQKERELDRKRQAALIQGFRTRDVGFRIFRSEKLERYQSLFDLAARYAYLAATAYDYETGLLGTREGENFIQRIVESRALGVFHEGQPAYAGSRSGDPGLSSALAELASDWEVTRSRLGFNNPDAYSTTVSLRSEAFRINPFGDGNHKSANDNWTRQLDTAIRNNLLSDADVARYCMQIDVADGRPVPGFVFEFSTMIQPGKNLFGNRLAPGDHAFSPTSFATKLFSAGVALEGYKGMSAANANGSIDTVFPFLDPNSLSATPYVYLIPVGEDIMRTPPLGDFSEIRSWSVQDVTIPLPFNLGASKYSNLSQWQTVDLLSDAFLGVRKHQAFRAVDSTGQFAHLGELANQQYTNNRLIGRSVWNTKWKLVIPANTLLSDEAEAIKRFKKTVTDIKLHFTTYSYAGN